MARKKNPVADVPEFLAHYRHLRDTVYNTLRQRQADHEKLYWCDYDVGLDPENFRSPTRPPTARMIVEHPVNHLAMDTVSVQRLPRLKGPGGLETKQAQEMADKIERWLQVLVEDFAHIQPYFLREIVKNLSHRGEAYIKIGLSSEFHEWLKEGGEEVYYGNPFVLDVPDAMNLYSSLDMDEGCIPHEVFEEKVMTARQVRRLMGKEEILTGIKDTALVTLVEWWTADFKGFFAGDVRKGQFDTIGIRDELAVPNPLGKVPYIRGFSGYGKMPDDGDPAKLVVGILTGLESLLIEQARLMTMMDTITAKHALPLAVLTVPEGVPVSGPLKLGPGQVFKEEGGVKFRYEQTPPIPIAIVQQMTFVNQRLEAFMPGVVSGIAETAGEAAISRVTRLTQASLLWESQYITSRRMIEKMLGQVLYLMETLVKVPVELRGLRLSPEDIHGYYDVGVDIKPGNPDELRWDAVLGMQLKGFLPDDVILEKYFHEPDSSQMMLKLAVQRVLATPMMIEFVGKQAMKELGYEAELAALEEQAAPVLQAEKIMKRVTPGSVPGVGGSPIVGAAALPEQETPLPQGMTTRGLIRGLP